MTKARDIKEIIVEGSAGPGERKALETLAGALETSLSREVPHRPEFKAELRRKLVAEARRTLTPWYRRPAVWGSSLGVVAAAAVLAVGLQMFRGPGRAPAQPSPVAQAPQEKGIVSTQVPLVPVLTNELKVPVVPVPDEVLTPASPGPESIAGLDVSQGLPVYLLTGRPDEKSFQDMALKLGFSEKGRSASGGYQVAQGSRTLQVSADGKVLFVDSAAGDSAGTPTAGPDGARAVARRFLDRAVLPVPDLQPAVNEEQGAGGQRIFTVTYTQRVEGRPVVNGRTLVRVTGRSGVARAEAFVATGQERKGPYAAITAEQALAKARELGGGAGFDGVDLVWVRTVSDEAIFLQPYWRFFGTNAQGARMARYVPALTR